MGKLFDELCKGPVIVIDDEIGNPETEIGQLIRELETKELPILKYDNLTDAKKAIQKMLFSNFIILDWRLTHIPDGLPGEVSLGTDAESFNDDKVTDFIKEIQLICPVPIFIISELSKEGIKSNLSDRGITVDGKNAIFIENKSALCQEEGKLIGQIEEWILTNPHVYLTKWWINEWLSKNNSLFWTLLQSNPEWPSWFYSSFNKDQVDPITSIRDILFQFIISEIDVSTLDSTILDTPFEESKDNISMLKDLWIKIMYTTNPSIHNEIRPGDIFKDGDSYYLNIRPECDTTKRTANPKIYLIKGDVKEPSDIKNQYNEETSAIYEKENQIILLFLDDHDIVVFNKGKLSVEKYSRWKTKKICRVVHPFVTRIRHQFSSYIGRFGVPARQSYLTDSIFTDS